MRSTEENYATRNNIENNIIIRAFIPRGRRTESDRLPHEQVLIAEASIAVKVVENQLFLFFPWQGSRAYHARRYKACALSLPKCSCFRLRCFILSLLSVRAAVIKQLPLWTQRFAMTLGCRCSHSSAVRYSE